MRLPGARAQFFDRTCDQLRMGPTSKAPQNLRPIWADAELYRLIISSIRDYAIFVMNAAGRVVTWNDGAARITGYSAEEILGQHFRRFFTPDEVEEGEPERLLELARQDGQAKDQGRRLRKNGSRFLADGLVTKMTDDSGRLIGFATITRDITERLRAEQADRERASRQQVQRELERLKAFAANIPGLAYRCVLDPDGSISFPFVAGQFAEQFNFAIPGAPETGADVFAITHPDDCSSLRNAIEQSACTLSALDLEARVNLLSGETRWMRHRATPGRGDQGEIIWNAIAFDVTKQRRLDERLRLLQTASLAVAEAEDFNSALTVVLQKVCVATGWDYGEAWVPNAVHDKMRLGPVYQNGSHGFPELEELSRKISVAPGEGIVGTVWQTQKFLQVPDLASAPQLHASRAKIALATGVRSVCALPIIVRGDVLAVMMFATVEKRKDGPGLAATMTAIASQFGGALQRKRTEQTLRERDVQLAQMQKMEAIGSLTGGMAHDFNNLLAIIVGNLDVAVEAPAIDPATRDLIGEATAAGLRGADLVRRLLAFARRQPLRPERLDPGQHVSEIAKLLRRTVGEHIEIMVDADSDAWPVIADRAQLEAAITNLATNARDAMPKGGRLTISVARRYLDDDYSSIHPEVTPGEYMLIAVSDTGAGIAPELMEHIFEPFFTTKDEGKGSGLGLSMVYGFIKQSGGHVSVYSEPGIGTSVRLYLPKAQDDTMEAVTKPATMELPRGEGELILAVEDNADLRRILERQLHDLGYRPLFAGTAREALGILESKSGIRLLFTDVIMPGGMTGIELAREVSGRWPGLRVLLTSGFAEAGIAQNGAEPIMARLLAKPYRKDELAAALRRALVRDGGR